MTNAVWRTRPPVLVPDGSCWWLGQYAGAGAVVALGDGKLDALVSGRDQHNRSHIGRVRIDLDEPERPPSVDADPVLAPGAKGCFDDSGVSYPCVVSDGGLSHLLYTGWTRAVSTPFQNDLGLAVQAATCRYQRASRAPILARNDADHLSIGSAYAIIEDGLWRLWYTAFTDWGDESADVPHRYVIKYATSVDGHTWDRDDVTCIGPLADDEHSICRPCVVRLDDRYHMWFCSRGDRYQIRYAWSADGVEWVRSEWPVEFGSSTPGFDDEERAYPHVVPYGDGLLMLYSGNGYGSAGLGVAVLDSTEALAGGRS